MEASSSPSPASSRSCAHALVPKRSGLRRPSRACTLAPSALSHLRIPPAYRCKFSGLVAFPFDHLRCAVEIGGWATSADRQGLLLQGDGVALLSQQQEATSGSSYVVYTIERVSAVVNTIV
eukprot:6499233-Prymnesium_polylepis.1